MHACAVARSHEEGGRPRDARELEGDEKDIAWCPSKKNKRCVYFAIVSEFQCCCVFCDQFPAPDLDRVGTDTFSCQLH